MQKLIQGILEFRRFIFPAYRMTFAKLATSQAPDCLFVGCSDSRVVPNLFASTNPGDLFVVRNVGNLVPRHGYAPSAESSVAAALEFATHALKVNDVVICGHSNCGAMKGLLEPPPGDVPNLCAWLGNAADSLERLRARGPLDPALPEHDQLSQINVLDQLDHLREYPFIRERVDAGALRLHGWWFDVGTADVHVFDPSVGRFQLIDETLAERMLAGGPAAP